MISNGGILYLEHGLGVSYRSDHPGKAREQDAESTHLTNSDASDFKEAAFNRPMRGVKWIVPEGLCDVGSQAPDRTKKNRV